MKGREGRVEVPEGGRSILVEMKGTESLGVDVGFWNPLEGVEVIFIFDISIYCGSIIDK